MPMSRGFKYGGFERSACADLQENHAALVLSRLIKSSLVAPCARNLLRWAIDGLALLSTQECRAFVPPMNCESSKFGANLVVY
jgi:hypothetical protein